MKESGRIPNRPRGVMLSNLGVERYRVIRLVGQGGMGELYEVWDERLERSVAVKRLHPHVLAQLGGEACLLKEARAAAKVEHPNVVRIYGVEKAQDELLIEMEFIEGRALNAVLDSSPMPGYLAADLLKQILQGLEACHARRIIHCDLKPANILVTPSGAVYITDFGIARAARSTLEQADEFSTEGTFGTPRYSAPEAWHGEEPTFKWDLYSTGVIIFEALAGVCPIGGETIADIRAEVFRGPGKKLRECRPDLSSGFLALIESLMASHAGDRPDSARDALALLRKTVEYKERKDSTRRLRAPEPPTPPTRPSVIHTRSPKRFVAMAVVTALLLLVLVAVALSARYAELPNAPEAVEKVGGPGERAVMSAQPASTNLREPLNLTKGSNGSYFFAYDDGIHGNELWGLVDQERAMLIADINPGPASSNPTNFMAREGSGVFFAATSAEFGQELWFCDEEYGGGFRPPTMVFDCEPGRMGSVPTPFASKTPCHLFLASTLKYGRELWCTSMRPGQTAMVADLNVGWPDSFDVTPTVHLAEKGLYLKGIFQSESGYSLGYYEYSSNSLSFIGDVDDQMHDMHMYQGKLFLMNSDDLHGMEMWVHDPAVGGLSLFKDLAPGKFGSWPKAYFEWRDILYFKAETEAEGIELWRTDGTPEGTWMVRDINPGKSHSNTFRYTPFGDRFLFSADHDAYGRELWISDGTAEGTQILMDIQPGPTWSTTYNVVDFDGRIFFTADDAVHGEELWVAEERDGIFGARMVTDLYPGPIGAAPHDLRRSNEKTGVFNARVSETNCWLHRLEIDGDTITMRRLPEPAPDQVELEVKPAS